MEEIIPSFEGELTPSGYDLWRNMVVSMIEAAKYNAVMKVNADLLSLYWNIGNHILLKQKEEGWGAKVIGRLSKDLTKRFPNDRGFSDRNLRNMKIFAEAYPNFPFGSITLEDLSKLPISQDVINKNPPIDGIWQVPLAKITWYHHISLLSKVSDPFERLFYVLETAENGWSRDVMLHQIACGYIHKKGKAVNNFETTLPPPQSELARDTFKDPYNFSFLGTVALQNEIEIEKKLAERITSFLLEMGKGFSFIGRQYHVVVDGDDYYIDLLMYHVRLHCYVVVELKAVEFKPEYVSKLNFYISAIDDYVKMPEDKPTIGLLLCRSKSNKKAEFSLRGFTQPMGIAQYETEQLLADVVSSLPQIEDIERDSDFFDLQNS